MRRILIIIASIIVILGILLGIYMYLTNRSSAHLTVNGGGSFGDTTSGTVQSTGQVGSAGAAGTVVAPNLVKITASPVAAGVSIVDFTPATTTLVNTASSSASSSQTVQSRPAQTEVKVHYIDRASGNVYEYGALSRTLTRISNKTLPGIQIASWVPNGSLAFVQFLAQANNSQHLDTYALPANGSDGYFLQQDLANAFALDAKSVVTLAAGTNSTIGSIANVDGTNEQTLFTSPLTSLNIYAAGGGVIAATKAAAELDGYAFAVNTDGSFAPVLGPLRGLTVLPSPSGNELLYSYTDGASFHMSVIDLSTGSVTALPLATFAEKCVWTSDDTALYCGIPTSLSGNEPDAWYQGTVSFIDRIWRIDLTTRLATLIIDPSQGAKTAIDVTDLATDPNGRVLIFRNKKDGSLWSYSL